MLNENVNSYIRNLVLSKSDEYNSYICYSNTTGSSYQTNYYDVYCTFGNDIELNSYTFKSNDGLNCSIDTNNYYNNNALEKLSCTKGNKEFTINNYEVIYTNIGEYFPSIIQDYEYNQLHNIGYNIDTTYCFTLLLLLVMPIVVGFVHHFFRIS